MRNSKQILIACLVAAVSAVTFAGMTNDASARGRVLSGNVVTRKPIVRYTGPTLRNAQGHRIPGRSLGRTKGQLLCNRTPSGGQVCRRVS